MRHRALLLLVLTLAFAVFAVLPSAAFAQSAGSGKVRIAGYNLEWFLDVFDDPYAKDESRPPKSRKSIELLAAALRKVNADVVTVQEVENEHVLRAMASEMLADQGYKFFAVLPSNSDRGQNLGIMSRLPIVSLTSHRFTELTLPGETRTWRFARDLFRARVQATPKRTMDVFVVHLKSRLDGEGDPQSAKWRRAEATAIRKVLDAELAANPQALFTVTGDFNDTPGSSGILTLLAPAADGKNVLIDVHEGLSPEKRFTYRKEPYRNHGPIDYILASPALASRLVSGSAQVLEDDTRITEGSDHLPVYADFNLAD